MQDKYYPFIILRTNGDYCITPLILMAAEKENTDLLALLRKGDEKSFTYLFNVYYSSLTDYACRILRDYDMSKDVVQSVFFKLYENHDAIHIQSDIKYYLYRAVYNKCVNELRHNKIISEYAGAKVLDFYLENIPQSPSAEIDLRYKEMKRYIDEAIERLPDRCRQVYEMSRHEDLSNKEIAESMDISVKTVEAHITKALALLHKELDWVLCLFAISFPIM